MSTRVTKEGRTMPLRRSSSMNDAFRRRSNSLRREAGRMSAAEMGAGLVKAIRCGDEAWLASLLAAGAPPNARDEAGRPVLYLLLESSGSPEVCKMLLERGALPDLPVPETGQTPLHAAARKGFQVCIGQLLSETANPDQPDALGNSPLLYACANSHDPSARMLIKAGAFAGRVNCRGETGLHLAARHGSIGCIKEMLAAGCPVDCLDQRGLTPLLIASITNQPDIVDLLLKQGSSAGEQDPLTGRTALHWAVHHRDQETATRLLRAGVEPDLRDVDWNTPFLIAANLGDRQMARMLAQAGSDVGVTDKSFSTALHLSSRDGHDELIPIFVESGLNLDLKGPGGLAPLMLGALGGHERVVRTLLAYGARPNLLDRNRASALIYALLSDASQECIGNIVKCLIQFGADLDEGANLIGLSRGLSLPPEVAKAALEDRLYSPVEVAYLRGSSYLCAILVRAGCDLSVFCSPKGAVTRAVGGRSPAVLNRELLQRLVQYARRQQRVVPSLAELCRRPVLRRISQLTSLARLDELGLPEDILRFLRYEDLDAAGPRPRSVAVPSAELIGRTNQGTRWNQSRSDVAEPAGTPAGTTKGKSRIKVESIQEPTGTPQGVRLRQSRSRMEQVSEAAVKSVGTKWNQSQCPQAFERNDPRRITIAEVPRSRTGNSRLNLHRKPNGYSDFSQEHQNLQANHQNSTGTSTSGSSGSVTPRSFSSRESSFRLTTSRATDFVTRSVTPTHGTLRTSRAKSSSNLSRSRAPPAPQGSGWDLSSRVRTPLNLDRTRSDQKIAATTTPWR